MRIFHIFVFLLFVPIVCGAASDGGRPSRSNDGAMTAGSGRTANSANARTNDSGAPASKSYSSLSDMYSDVMVIVRALISPRPTQGTGAAATSAYTSSGRVAPRTVPTTYSKSYYGTSASGSDIIVRTKQDYINFLKSSSSGHQNDCADRYNKFTTFFGYQSDLSGQIGAKSDGPSTGRLDMICDFMDYSQWCFALGFAYNIRDFDNNDWLKKGYKCFTYQEFCESMNKTFDSTKVDEYLSRVIDEVVFYNTNIRNTDKNTVMVTTEKLSGGILTTSTSWKGYTTDTWVAERISGSETARLLCK